jgi:hypothetical protein
MKSWLATRKSCDREGFGHRPAVAAACIAILVSSAALGQASRRRPPDVPRSKPPGGTWDRVTADTFLPDAFSTLQGRRPTFGSGARRAVTPSPGGGPAEPTAPGDFKWSALVSEDTLTDEVKDAKAALVAACGKPTDFKGGGFEQARVRFSSLALAFGVIAAYDQDVRWKKDAAAARDLFARAGFNCKVGTDQSFAESKARLEDLEAMLDGSPPKAKPDRDEDFAWSQVAGRPALMNRLEEAQDAMRPAVASKADFGGAVDELRHAVEIVAVIGEVIQQPDFEYHDDDTYRGHAAAMRDAAADVREACDKKDYEAARAAAGRIEKACDACHGEYRS